jgi:hypothetical protein
MGKSNLCIMAKIYWCREQTCFITYSRCQHIEHKPWLFIREAIYNTCDNASMSVASKKNYWRYLSLLNQLLWMQNRFRCRLVIGILVWRSLLKWKRILGWLASRKIEWMDFVSRRLGLSCCLLWLLWQRNLSSDVLIGFFRIVQRVEMLRKGCANILRLSLAPFLCDSLWCNFGIGFSTNTEVVRKIRWLYF